ncbi:MAG: hypothetical protein GPJ54_16020 [Candidatus Heimdallarchaeota archaeon]|nr:hypothetical protein [Candidatus Heimdallarchaeota archaeon]
MNRVISRKIGIWSGLSYIMLLFISIPLLIILDPDFSKSLNSFDPLSQLGSTEFSEGYYRTLHVFAGMLALLYIELEFVPNRQIYRNLKNWDWALRSLRIGALGEIAMGIFDESFFPHHLFATIAFAVGGVTFLALVSFNLDNQLLQKDNIKRLINSGYIISIIAMMNALYFRYSTVRGIWQFLVLATVILWYVFESRNFKTFNSEILIAEETPLLKVNNISYLMFAFGIYLIIFGILLYAVPTMWPWSCGPNDKRCDISNIIPLLISGAILVSFVLFHRSQVNQNVKEFNKANINI